MCYSIYDHFRFHHPGIAKNVEKYHERGSYELIAELKDGSIVSYHDFDKSTRQLPRDANDMSEEECLCEFGIRLQKIMWTKGITQNELSKRTGIDQSTISKYMNGKHSPSFYKIDKIAKVVGCSVDDLRYF